MLFQRIAQAVVWSRRLCGLIETIRCVDRGGFDFDSAASAAEATMGDCDSGFAVPRQVRAPQRGATAHGGTEAGLDAITVAACGQPETVQENRVQSAGKWPMMVLY
jgi:hypothetical protein